MDDLLSLAEAADELGIAAVTLRAARERGRFAARLFGNTYVTTRAEVERYRREHLGQVGRPPTEIRTYRTPGDGFEVIATFKVSPGELEDAIVWVDDAVKGATRLDETFDVDSFRPDPLEGFEAAELVHDQVNGRLALTVRHRPQVTATIDVRPDSDRVRTRQEIVPPTREPGH